MSDLGQEPLGTDDRCEFRLQDLECDLPLVLDVFGEIDGRHPPFTELGLDPVATREGRFETIRVGVGITHWAAFLV